MVFDLQYFYFAMIKIVIFLFCYGNSSIRVYYFYLITHYLEICAFFVNTVAVSSIKKYV